MEPEMKKFKKIAEAFNRLGISADEAKKSILVYKKECTIALNILLYPELLKYYYIYRRTKKKRIAKKMKDKIYKYLIK